FTLPYATLFRFHDLLELDRVEIDMPDRWVVVDRLLHREQEPLAVRIEVNDVIALDSRRSFSDDVSLLVREIDHDEARHVDLAAEQARRQSHADQQPIVARPSIPQEVALLGNRYGGGFRAVVQVDDGKPQLAFH